MQFKVQTHHGIVITDGSSDTEIRFREKENIMLNWRLPKTFESTDGSIVFNVIGEGPPLVLVHGTPSWSYLWRHVVDRLKINWKIYVYDLLGYGNSERSRAQNVTIENQARILRQLLDFWELNESSPCVVGHDIGGAVVLAANLIEGFQFQKIILLDAVIISPWITDTTRHQQKYIECYKTMPRHIYEQVAMAHLRTAFHKDPGSEILMNYFDQWKGEEGQFAWFRNVEQFDESITDRLEKLFHELTAPVKLLWGEYDTWLPPAVAHQAKERIGKAELEIITNAGHFSPEDNPAEVSEKIDIFCR
jgi:pimeloyl-ACP methyl ester carboxylesterase